MRGRLPGAKQGVLPPSRETWWLPQWRQKGHLPTRETRETSSTPSSFGAHLTNSAKVQGTHLNKLHDQIKLGVKVKLLYETNDVSVLHTPQNCYFIGYHLFFSPTFILVNYF